MTLQPVTEREAELSLMNMGIKEELGWLLHESFLSVMPPNMVASVPVDDRHEE